MPRNPHRIFIATAFLAATMAWSLPALAIEQHSPSTGESGKQIPVPMNACDLSALRASVDSLKADLSGLRKAAEDTAEKKAKESRVALFGGLAAVLAAIVAGTVAMWNQRKQALQSRTLKAIELIMESRSPVQASTRRENLKGFLDTEAQDQMQGIEKSFAGDEWTSLRIELARSMADKAPNPKVVLAVWRAVFANHPQPENKSSEQVKTYAELLQRIEYHDP